MPAHAIPATVAGTLGVPRPSGRGRRPLIEGRKDVTRLGKRTASPAFRAMVSKRVVEAACDECRAMGYNLTRCEVAIATVARRFNLRLQLVVQMAYSGTVHDGPNDFYGHATWVGRYDFGAFDNAPERERLEAWEAAMARTAPLRELVALVRDMPTAEAGAAVEALLERMDPMSDDRERVSFAVYRFLTAVDLTNSVRELLAEATEWAKRVYEERVADEPMIASLEVV